MSVMIERLEGMVNRYHEINEMMMSPEISNRQQDAGQAGTVSRPIVTQVWKPIRNIKRV